jgi:hypothetical protein
MDSFSYPHDENINYNYDYDNCNDNNDDDEMYRMIERRHSDESSSSSDSSIVDSLVDVSKKCNTWVVEYCTMCTNYMDKQVQYEVMSQATTRGTTALSAIYQRPAGTFDLQGSLAGYANCHHDVRDIMFDEESVVESVISR